jgi:hypothetical protein
MTEPMRADMMTAVGSLLSVFSVKIEARLNAGRCREEYPSCLLMVALPAPLFAPETDQTLSSE